MTQEQRNSLENIERLKPVVERARAFGIEKRHEEAYRLLLPYFENGEMPMCFGNECGWVIFQYLKLGKESKMSIDARKALSFYFAVCQPVKSLLHSLIMVQAVGLEKKHQDDFRFVEFCLMWNLGLMRDEDFVRQTMKTDEGKIFEYNSLAEDVAARLYKEMKQRHTQQFAQSLLPFMERVAEKCRQNKFIPMYVAQMWLWAGDKEKAVDSYKKLLQTSPDWYLWKNLGEIVDDADDKISFFCKAMTLQGKEDFIGDLRLSLARLLVEKNPPQALYEVNRFYDTYTRNKWGIPDKVRVLADRLHGIAPESNPKAFYQANVERAEAFVYAEFPEMELTFTGSFVNKAGKKRAGFVGERCKVSVGLSAFPTLKMAEPGDVFKARMAHRDNRWQVLSLCPTGKKNLDALRQQPTEKKQQNEGTEKTVSGKVSLPREGEFAFIDKRYFVPPGLRKKHNLLEGQTVTAKVKQMPDGKWRVMTIEV